MEQRFVIVGGLADDHDRGNLIAALEARTVSAGLKLSWDWIKSSAREGWRPPLKYLNQLSASVDRDQKEGRQPPKLVLLRRLNKESRARVLTIDPDPVLVEPDKFSGPDLVEWLFSAEAGLTPQSEWVAETRLAAFICILAKLLRKKSWNKDKHGHAWTQEIHLLNDSPVDIPDRSDVRQEAERLLSRMKDLLLLTKGGNQGKTPKEWSILLTRLPLVKQSFLKRSLDPMRADAALEEILEYVESGEGRQYRIDDVIGEEKIRVLCREVDRAVTEKQSG